MAAVDKVKPPRRRAIRFAVALVVSIGGAIGWWLMASHADHGWPTVTIRARGYVSGFAWSPDESVIATISDWGRYVSVWHLDGKKARELGSVIGPYYDKALYFLDNTRLLTPPRRTDQDFVSGAYRSLTIWNVATGEAIGEVASIHQTKHESYSRPRDFAVSKDGSLAAYVTIMGKEFYLVDTVQSRIVARQIADLSKWRGGGPGDTNALSATSVSPSAKSVAVAGRREVLIYSTDDLEAAPRRLSLHSSLANAPPGEAIDAAAFSRDGRRFAYGDKILGSVSNVITPEIQQLENAKSVVAIWNVADGRLELSFSLEDLGLGQPKFQWIRGLSWGRDDEWMAIFMGNKVAILRFTEKSSEISLSDWRVWTFDRNVGDARFSNSGRFLAVATSNVVEVFDVEKLFER